jgi:hypothetical protein
LLQLLFRFVLIHLGILLFDRCFTCGSRHRSQTFNLSTLSIKPSVMEVFDAPLEFWFRAGAGVVHDGLVATLLECHFTDPKVGRSRRIHLRLRRRGFVCENVRAFSHENRKRMSFFLSLIVWISNFSSPIGTFLSQRLSLTRSELTVR